MVGGSYCSYHLKVVKGKGPVVGEIAIPHHDLEDLEKTHAEGDCVASGVEASHPVSVAASASSTVGPAWRGGNITKSEYPGTLELGDRWAAPLVSVEESEVVA